LLITDILQDIRRFSFLWSYRKILSDLWHELAYQFAGPFVASNVHVISALDIREIHRGDSSLS
jgi:hypothetical protein